MDTVKLCEILSAMSKRMEKEKDWLTELDNEIADGDHGINMARGFAAVEQKLSELSDKDIKTVLKTVGMTVVSAVGGSAGPLYGTAFMKSGMAMDGKTDMDIDDFIVCLKESIDGIMMRGKAVKGEKTMLDAMIPAYEAIKEARANGLDVKEIIESGVKASWDGAEYTKSIAATKGRASYIGERSIGHMDPGAASFSCLLEVIKEEI